MDGWMVGWLVGCCLITAISVWLLAWFGLGGEAVSFDVKNGDGWMSL
jgi:hypothetical protein